MKISVTRDDISKGRRHEPDTCAVARAIRRSFTARPVIVWAPEVLIGPTKYILPNNVTSAILNHDRRIQKMEPMEFDLTETRKLNRQDRVVLGRFKVTE